MESLAGGTLDVAQCFIISTWKVNWRCGLEQCRGPGPVQSDVWMNERGIKKNMMQRRNELFIHLFLKVIWGEFCFFFLEESQKTFSIVKRKALIAKVCSVTRDSMKRVSEDVATSVHSVKSMSMFSLSNLFDLPLILLHLCHQRTVTVGLNNDTQRRCHGSHVSLLCSEPPVASTPGTPRSVNCTMVRSGDNLGSVASTWPGLGAHWTQHNQSLPSVLLSAAFFNRCAAAHSRTVRRQVCREKSCALKGTSACFPPLCESKQVPQEWVSINEDTMLSLRG